MSDIKKINFVSKDMSKNEDKNTGTKNIFMDVVKDYIDLENTQYNNLDTPIPVEIDLGNGIKKVIDNTNLSIGYVLNSDKKKNEIASINKTLNKNLLSISYHKFSYNTPANSINSNYSYDLSLCYQESLLQENKESKTSYRKGSFIDYNEKVEKEGIVDFKKIKNYYLMDTIAIYNESPRGDDYLNIHDFNLPIATVSEVEEYYKGALSPSIFDNWDKYRVFLFSNEQVSSVDKSLNYVNVLPEYVSCKIPTIQGFSLENQEFASSANLMFSSKTKFGEMPEQDLYISAFINYVYNSKSTEIYQFSNYMNDALGSMKYYPLPSLFFNLGYDDYKAVKDNQEYFINNKSYSANFFPNKDMFVDMFNLSKERIFDIIKNKKNTDFVPLYYKVNKFYKDFNAPSQEFYIPYKTGSKLNFVDNQVLPNEKYSYSVSLVGVSVGISCLIKHKAVNPTSEHIYELNAADCFTEPIVIEIPFIEKTVAAEKRSFPAIPEINIFSSNDDPTSLKIFLSNKKSFEAPIFLTAQEERKILHSDLNLENGSGSFSNEYFKSYFIYRIDQASPATYSSFISDTAKINSTDSNKKEFFDSIEYNKKYYYMARSFNGSFFSNPSNIMEVEIKNMDGVIIPVIKSFSFNSGYQNGNNFLLPSQKFKEVISISPSYKQLVFKAISDDIEKTYKNASIDIDIDKFPGLQSVFQVNPKFKIRLISKHSGKMIDINLKYRLRIRNNIK